MDGDFNMRAQQNSGCWTQNFCCCCNALQCWRHIVIAVIIAVHPCCGTFHVGFLAVGAVLFVFLLSLDVALKQACCGTWIRGTRENVMRALCLAWWQIKCFLRDAHQSLARQQQRMHTPVCRVCGANRKWLMTAEAWEPANKCMNPMLDCSAFKWCFWASPLWHLAWNHKRLHQVQVGLSNITIARTKRSKQKLAALHWSPALQMFITSNCWWGLLVVGTP